MHAIAGSEVRMNADRTGLIRAEHQAGARNSWAPYVSAFGGLTVVARVRHNVAAGHGPLAEGEGVEVAPIPFYAGLKGLLSRLPSVVRTIWRIGDKQNLFIGRMPEPISILLYIRARALRARFLTILVVEPRQLGRVTPGLRGRVKGAALAAITRNAVAHSVGVVYVTQEWLQELYPARPRTPTLGRSNVILDTSAFVASSRRHGKPLTHPRLVTVAALGRATKGVDQLIRVVSELVRRGRQPMLTVIGSGAELENLRALADALNIGHAVTFTGHISDRQKLVELIDQADIYVSMSRAEGVSRSMIEAMARGLPVIATIAGGTEEILATDCLVEIGDQEGMRTKLEYAFDTPVHLDEMSRENLGVAKEVASLAAPERLIAFLETLQLESRTAKNERRK